MCDKKAADDKEQIHREHAEVHLPSCGHKKRFVSLEIRLWQGEGVAVGKHHEGGQHKAKKIEVVFAPLLDGSQRGKRARYLLLLIHRERIDSLPPREVR